MKISIGILAYNESILIRKTIESLSKQDLFQESKQELDIEIIVVPNGCTDDTSSVASNALESFFSNTHQDVVWKIFEQEEAGKSNAWNTYVHKLSDSDSQYLFLMDSDIELIDPSTLRSMLSVLDRYPEAWVSVDKPIKDVVFRKNKTVLDYLSIFVSGLSGGNPKLEGPAWICGQLYCARASNLREIYLPKDLPAQDSFLYTIISTDGLRSDVNPNRVILAGSATHKFEAYTQPGRLLRHEKWLILSSAINEMMFAFLRSKRQDTESLGVIIEQLNRENPSWLSQCIQEMVISKGYWLVPRFILIRRFLALRNKPFLKAMLLLPISTCAFFVDLVLSMQANQELHQKSEVGYWGK